MSDLIRRRDAIDALRNTKFRNDLFMDIGYATAIGIIKELPAVQPGHIADVSKKVERASETAQNVRDEDLISKLSEIRSEYNCFDEDGEPQYRALSEAIRILSQLADGDTISRQAAIDAVGDWIYNPEDLRYHKDVINSIPAAQPEIVRCKDCKHWDTEWSVSESGAHYCPMVDGNRNSDFYCADAERRIDDKTNKGSSC